MTGPAFRSKFIWAVSAYLTHAEDQALDSMYQAWDQDRSEGLPAGVGVLDDSMFDPVSSSAIFSTPPVFTRVNHNLMIADFGLTEI